MADDDEETMAWLEDIYDRVKDPPVSGPPPSWDDLETVLARHRDSMAQLDRLDKVEPVAAAYMNIAATRFDDRERLARLRAALEEAFRVTLSIDEGGEWHATARRQT